MALYPVYATPTNLAAYLGIQEASLPQDSLRLLRRASELVSQKTLGKVDLNNPNHVEAAELATCAQVEYWMGFDESMSTTAGYKSISIGSFSVDFGDKSGKEQQLSTRSRNYLNDQGLLYRGVRTYAGTDVYNDSDLSN